MKQKETLQRDLDKKNREQEKFKREMDAKIKELSDIN